VSAPDFLADVDNDERAELAALGVELTPPANINDAERDAFVSQLLWALGAVEQDRARYEEALGAEINRIRMRYQARIDRCQRRAQQLRDAVHILAAEADFGKKKSRDVGNGTYGRRTVPEKITIVDEPVAWKFAETSAPELITATVALELPTLRFKYPELEASAKLALSKTKLNEYVKRTGEEPPGVTVEPSREQPFCKVE